MKKNLIILFQLFILITIYQTGMFISKWTGMPVPGNVLGMVILFLLLWTGLLPLNWIERASTMLINHLSSFFIPISVGMMTLGEFLGFTGLKMVLILIISTAIGLFFSGSMTQLLLHKKERPDVESHHHSL